MDMTPKILIFTPIFLPIALDLGIDPVHFGIMMTFNLAISICTPPVGSALFIGCSGCQHCHRQSRKPLPCHSMQHWLQPWWPLLYPWAELVPTWIGYWATVRNLVTKIDSKTAKHSNALSNNKSRWFASGKRNWIMKTVANTLPNTVLKTWLRPFSTPKPYCAVTLVSVLFTERTKHLPTKCSAKPTLIGAACEINKPVIRRRRPNWITSRARPPLHRSWKRRWIHER